MQYTHGRAVEAVRNMRWGRAIEALAAANRITLLTAPVAACRQTAVLGHRSAPELWGLLPP
jgi:hypothetical protein